jgi:hypothetical protein
MSAPTGSDHQIIKAPDGTPLFAVIPWAEYEEVFEGRPDEAVFLPQEVVELVHLKDMSLIRA